MTPKKKKYASTESSEYKIELEFIESRIDDIKSIASRLTEVNTSDCGDALSATGDVLKEISRLNRKYGIYHDSLQNRALHISKELHDNCIAKSIEEIRITKTKK